MNQSYFDQVYRKTYPNLMQYAIVHLSDPTDAEDALQNVYVKFYRRIETYGRFDILMPEAFLKRMMKNEIVKHYKLREKRRLHTVDDAEQDQIPDEAVFEDAAINRTLIEEIFQEAKRLPKETYRTFVLFYGYELTIPEIAKRLQVTETAVKTRLCRARTALKEKLSENNISQKRTEM